jgi:hypothetical protein
MDIVKSRLISLEDIASNYESVLIDTSSFQGVLEEYPNSVMEELKDYLIEEGSSSSSGRDLRHLEKITNYLIKKRSFNFFVENLKYYKNCCTIPEVVQEIKNARDYDYKRKIKERNHKKIPHLPKLRRSIRDSNIERNRLVRLIEDEQRILKLDEEEKNLYKELYEKYKSFESYYPLHGADLPLLIYGAVRSYTKEFSAIISNDSKLGYAWRYFLKKECLSRRKFEFFVRKDICAFEKWR